MAIQARTEFSAALNQLASEKGVEVSVVIEAIEQAALAAFRKDLSLKGEEIPEDFDSLTAQIDPGSGEIKIKRGEENITPPGFARIAAQTAKQVIMQRLNEAEKGAIMDEYGKKVGTVVAGTIQRQEGNTFFVDLGRAEGVLPPQEQARDEYYHLNKRLKVFIKEIREGRRGPEVVVSRADPGLVKGLFALEVPEVASGAVTIKDVAREAGSRTKISAVSTQEGVDPVGSLVGQKGVRVQAVMQELSEEKIDIITFSEDPARYIAAALSPAKDVIVSLENKEEKRAKVKVADSQLSLAIGRGGQNVRLAARLTGWKIDIEGMGGSEKGTSEKEKQKEDAKPTSDDTQSPTNLASDAKVEEGKIEEKTKAEDEAKLPGFASRADVVEQVEEVIDKVVEEEAGTTQPEPTVEEVAEAAPVAEADMEKADKEEKINQVEANEEPK